VLCVGGLCGAWLDGLASLGGQTMDVKSERDAPEDQTLSSSEFDGCEQSRSFRL